jgi:RNA polymerase sigma-70 factor (ECF subfamily)
MSARTRPSNEVPAMSGVGGAGVDDVVRRAQQGDVAAFEAIYRSHTAAVYALCRRMLGDERDARDLVQDVFVRAWERLTTFRGQSAFGTWLHRLAVNVTLEHMRRSKRDAARLIDVDDGSFGVHHDATTVEVRMDLDAAMDRLPRGARAVFLLHDVEGYSHDEIAEMTGIAAATARVQLWRARRTLMRWLDT